MKAKRGCSDQSGEEDRADDDGGDGGNPSLFAATPTDATSDTTGEGAERTSDASEHVRGGGPGRGEASERPTPRFLRSDTHPTILQTDAGTLRLWPRWAAVDLTVTAASHVRVRLAGATRWFRAGMVHLERSTGVVGSNCLLRQEEHFHLHHLEVSFDLLVESQAVMESLRKAIAEPRHSWRVQQFQRVVSRTLGAERPSDVVDQVKMRVREPCSVTARASTLVLGDSKKVTREVRFISELTTINAAVLLAADFELAAAFISRLASGEGASREELTTLFADAAGHVGDLDLIRGATDLRDPETSVFRAQGQEMVDNAVGVLIGSGNQLDRSVTVRRPDGTLRLFPGFEEVFELAAQVRRRELEQREAILTARERAMKASFLLANRQRGLDARERGLGARERGLDVRERELDTRERRLDARERELAARERELDTSKSRIAGQERSPGERRRGPENRLDGWPKDLGDRDDGYGFGF